MVTIALDGSDAAAEKPSLLRLAAASLLVPGLVQIACAVVASYGGPSVYIPLTVTIIWACAMSAAAVPAVLVEHRVAFRGLLIVMHVTLAWIIFVAASYPPARIEVLLAFIWLTTGVVGGTLLLSTLFGWMLTRDPEHVRRRTFSLRGMFVGTAAMAVLLSSPKFIPLILEMTFHGTHRGDMRDVTRTHHILPDYAAALVALGIAGVIGVLLAIQLSAAVWSLHSSLARRALLLGSVPFGMLAGWLVSLSLVNQSALAAGMILTAFLIAGSLMATQQAAIWQRAGWQLVRLRSHTVPRE